MTAPKPPALQATLAAIRKAQGMLKRAKGSIAQEQAEHRRIEIALENAKIDRMSRDWAAARAKQG